MIARAATADALVFAPRGEGELAAGERVRIARIAAPARKNTVNASSVASSGDSTLRKIH